MTTDNSLETLRQRQLSKIRQFMRMNRKEYEATSQRITHLKGFTRKNYQSGDEFVHIPSVRSYLQRMLEKERDMARILNNELEYSKVAYRDTKDFDLTTLQGVE